MRYADLISLSYRTVISHKLRSSLTALSLVCSRSHALRGNAVKARCAASHAQCLVYTGRGASCTAFPRSAWELGVE